MNDIELMRLYLLYKAGSVQDGRKNSDLLKAAKATASDLTEDEFAWLNKEIEHLRTTYESQTKDQSNTSGASQDNSGGGWNVWKAAKSFAMGSSEYQKRLWELPGLVRSDKPFTPTRLADGNPIDLDPNDAEGSQERLKAQPYSQVKHDPKLRDAWHAAQSGKLAEMLRGSDAPSSGWDVLLQGSSPATPVSSAPLRKLLESFSGSESTASKAPDLSPGSIRYYHGTTADDASNFSGKTFLTPQYNYARDYRSGNKNVLYTDFSKDEAISRGLYDETNNFPINGSIDDGKDRLKKLRENIDLPRSARQNVAAPPIVGVPNIDAGGNVVPPPIDIGRAARQNVADPSMGIVEDPLNLPGSPKKGVFGGAMDMLQTGLDAAGVADPTPIVDGLNAGISVIRAFTDPKNAGTHLVNAGVSAVSMVPYLGDLAKVFKYGGKAAKVGEEAAKVGSHGGGIAGTIGNLLGGLGGSGGGGGSGSGAGSAPAGSGDGFDWKMFASLSAGAIGLIAAFKALGAWVDRTVASGERLLESQRDLARYSGELSNAFAKYDTKGVFRQVRSAEYLSSSAVGLAGSQSNLKDAVAFRDLPQKRFNNDFGNVMAQVATLGVYLQSVSSGWNLLLRGVYGIWDATKESKNDDPRSGIEALFQKIEADKAAEDAKKNPAKQPPPRLPADGINQVLQDRLNRINVR